MHFNDLFVPISYQQKLQNELFGIRYRVQTYVLGLFNKKVTSSMFIFHKNFAYLQSRMSEIGQKRDIIRQKSEEIDIFNYFYFV